MKDDLLRKPDQSPWSQPDVDDLVRRRQRGRAIVMGLLLGGLVVLVFFITIAKIRAGTH